MIVFQLVILGKSTKFPFWGTQIFPEFKKKIHTSIFFKFHPQFGQPYVEMDGIKKNVCVSYFDILSVFVFKPKVPHDGQMIDFGS